MKKILSLFTILALMPILASAQTSTEFNNQGLAKFKAKD